MKLKLHFSFDGQAARALEFYKELFDGTVTMAIRYADVPDMCDHSDLTAEQKNRLLHANLVIPNNIQFEFCDTAPNESLVVGNNAVVNIYEKDPTKARAYFDALAEGGNVEIPYAPMPWCANYGRLTDRFGTTWQVMQDE